MTPLEQIKTVKRALGLAAKRARIERGLTQRALAELAHSSESGVWRVECGKSTLDAAFYASLTMGVSLSEIAGVIAPAQSNSNYVEQISICC